MIGTVLKAIVIVVAIVILLAFALDFVNKTGWPKK